MYQILAYGADNTNAAVLADTPALNDQNFVPVNKHWFFQESYKLMAKAVFGASVTAAQLFDSTWNSINVPQIYPVNVSATVPSNPQIVDLRKFPISIPQNEEIALQLSNNAVAPEWEFGLIFIAPMPDDLRLPAPPQPIGNMGRVQALATVTTTLTQGAWSADATMTMTNIMHGGTYCIAGAQVICAQGIAYRMNFPRQPLYMGRKLTPGNICVASYANIVQKEGCEWLGPMGYFDTVQYPYIAILGATTVGSTTYTVILDLIYMGPQLISQQTPPNPY
jgi:hypothetical protein